MHDKRRPPTFRSWPEQQLAWHQRRRVVAWIERDGLVALWMHGASTRDWVVNVLRVVSRIGDGWAWYVTVVLLPLIDSHSGTSASVRMICVGIVDIAVYKIVKRWIARPRPFRTCAGIRECTPSLDEFSFPSGHTLHSVACSVILTAYYPVLGFVVWPLTGLIAVSRIVLGLHYPSDVIVGALIGAIIATVSFNLL